LRQQGAGAGFDAGVVQQVGARRCDVGQHHAGDGLAGQRFACEQGAGQAVADEAGAAGDE